MSDKKFSIELTLDEANELLKGFCCNGCDGDNPTYIALKKIVDENRVPRMEEPPLGTAVMTDDGFAYHRDDDGIGWIVWLDGDYDYFAWEDLKNPRPVSEFTVPEGYIMIKRPEYEIDLIGSYDLKIIRDDADVIGQMEYGDISFNETIPSLIRNYADAREEEINK